MNDFVMAALPWVCIGLSLALTAVRFAEGKRDIQESYLLECLCLGICLGVMGGGRGMCYGMLLGTGLGMLLPKSQPPAETEATKETG